MSRHGHRFFVDDLIAVGSSLALPRPQSHQIASVLRLKPGDQIRLFNGDGREYECVLSNVTRTTVSVDVKRSEPGIVLPPPPIHLALALIKSDHFEWALQKATELGVERIIPMDTEHAVISLRVDREERRLLRWKRIVVEASEQSGRATVPDVSTVTSYADVFQKSGDAEVVLLWEDEMTRPLTDLILDRSQPVLLIVGPEGGFSEAEVNLARRAGAMTASLGRLTLRAETAAMAATAMVAGQRMARSAE